MGTSVLLVAIVASSVGATVSESAKNKQNEIFQRYWGTEFVWKFDELPATAQVPDHRIPYSGYIYPDTSGGTINALRKYDYAFNGRRYAAAGFEQWDTTAFQEATTRRGLFFRRTVMSTPHWHGHCNGWAAAAMRHAEPKKNVERNGVVFTPADIKGLLAEIYIYNDTINLDGPNYTINPGTFHAILANWIGRGAHPIGMEADPGKEKWNYPIYGYTATATKYGNNQVDVRMRISYAKDSRGEYQQSPRIAYTKYFHYGLTLDRNGEIASGTFYRDSSMIDLLWLPLRPKQGKQAGNERGNPHVDVNKVLAIWRDSVSEDIRKRWPLIDPPEADRVAEFTDVTTLIPVQEQVIVAEEEAPPAATDEPAAEEGDTVAVATEPAAPEAASDGGSE